MLLENGLGLTTKLTSEYYDREAAYAKKDKKDAPFHIQFPKDIREMFQNCGQASGKFAAEVGSRMRIKYRQSTWQLKLLEIREDGTAVAKLEAVAVPISSFRGMGFQGHRLNYSDAIILELSALRGYKRKRNGEARAFTDLTLWLRLTPEQVSYLCGESKNPEKFMLALSLTTLADSTMANITRYTDPKTLPTRKKSQKTNIIVRLPKGRLLFLPPIDTRDKITKQLRESFDPDTLAFDTSKQEFKHDIIYWNLDYGELKYISSSGQQMSYAISGSSELSNSATLSVLKSKWEEIIIKLGKNPREAVMNGIREYVNINHPDVGIAFLSNAAHTPTPKDFIRDATITTSEEKAREILDGCANWMRTKYASELIPHPLRRYSALAIIKLMAEYVGKVTALEEEIQKKIESMQEATVADMPKLPGNLRDDLEFWPHQAEVIAKADRSDESIGFDVSTGGGKTLLILCHILNEMQKGNIKRPLIVMPKNLVSQWFDQIHYFTNSTVNVIVMDTETMKKWGEEAMGDLIESAPINTIYLSTYSWIVLDNKKSTIGGQKAYYFPKVDFIKKYAFDSIFSDESHNFKNATTDTHQAMIQLGQLARRKGIATGTITPNKQSDIVGQTAFLDPALFGTKKDFEDEFLVDAKAGVFDTGAEAIIQERLRSIGIITKTRKDWFYTLPKINDNFHMVHLSERQRVLYDSLITDIVNDYNQSKDFKDQWTEFMLDPESEHIPATFLARLHLIESFSSDPAASPFGIDGLLDGDDLISPKLPKVLEILEDHFSKTPDDKVLIFNQYKEKVIDHFYDNLGPFQKMAKLYRGGLAKNLDAFKNDPKIKILVACDKSIKEGQNLQMASRMIRLDVHWSPGDLDQVIARIYRLLKGVEREYINIDWVLCDNTIDILKFRRTIRKLVLNSSMLGIVPPDAIPQRPIITVNPDTLQVGTRWADAWKDEAQDYRRYRELEGEQWEELRKTQPVDFIPVKKGEKIKGSFINTPIPTGASLPNGENRTTAEDALDEWAKGDHKNLIGHRCETEFGPGTIRTASKPKGKDLKVSVDFDDESIESKTLPGSIVEVFEEIDPNFGMKKINIDEPGVDVEIGGRLYWLTPKGILHKTRPVKGVHHLGKMYLIFDGFQWTTTAGRKTKKVTPKIDAGLRKALKKMGYKFPRGSGVVPDELKPESEEEEVLNEFRFNRKEDGFKKKFALFPDGTIRVLKLLKSGKFKYLKPHIIFEDGEWIYKSGIKKGKKVYSKGVKVKLLEELKKLGGLKAKRTPKRTKKETITPLTPQKGPKAPKAPIIPKGKIKKVVPKGNIEDMGYKFKTPQGHHRLLTGDGTIHKYYPQSKAIKPKYFFDKDSQTWFTPSGRMATFEPAEKKKLLKHLAELQRGVSPKLPSTPLSPKTPKATKPKEAKIPLSVSLEAINFGGVSAIAVFYEDEDRSKEIELAVRGNKFYPFTYKELSPITVPKINRLRGQLKGKFKPLNKDALLPILDNWRKAELHMKDYDADVIKDFKAIMKKGWISKAFYLHPTIVRGSLELWVPTMKEASYKPHKRVLDLLKFEDNSIFLRHFLRPATLVQAGSFLLTKLKAKGIRVSNTKEFKSALKQIKKRVS